MAFPGVEIEKLPGRRWCVQNSRTSTTFSPLGGWLSTALPVPGRSFSASPCLSEPNGSAPYAAPQFPALQSHLLLPIPRIHSLLRTRASTREPLLHLPLRESPRCRVALPMPLLHPCLASPVRGREENKFQMLCLF